MTDQATQLNSRLRALEAACKLAHDVIEGSAVSGADYARVSRLIDDTQAQCFGGFPAHAIVESRFGEEQAVIGWPDLALARDALAKALATEDESTPPALDIDAKLHPDGKIHGRGLLERRIVWGLLRHLRAAGFHPILHCDGEDDVEVKGDLKQCMELTFNLDECRIYFARDPSSSTANSCGSVLIILGNGEDCISDWSWKRGEEGEGTFDYAMNVFDAEVFL